MGNTALSLAQHAAIVFGGIGAFDAALVLLLAWRRGLIGHGRLILQPGFAEVLEGPPDLAPEPRVLREARAIADYRRA